MLWGCGLYIIWNLSCSGNFKIRLYVCQYNKTERDQKIFRNGADSSIGTNSYFVIPCIWLNNFSIGTVNRDGKLILSRIYYYLCVCLRALGLALGADHVSVTRALRFIAYCPRRYTLAFPAAYTAVVQAPLFDSCNLTPRLLHLLSHG